ncbi:hypothetical protein [Streptomyces sp. NPDC059003]|uniref:hypothetical protein n=1 Tax=Streptomyces sp. NPDC059003 TaxID=3346691 RepID=UPI0036C796CE
MSTMLDISTPVDDSAAWAEWKQVVYIRLPEKAARDLVDASGVILPKRLKRYEMLPGGRSTPCPACRGVHAFTLWSANPRYVVADLRCGHFFLVERSFLYGADGTLL